MNQTPTPTTLSDDTSQSFKIRTIRYIGILATLGLSIVFFYLYFTQTYPEIYDTINSQYYSPVVAGIAFILIFFRAYSSPKGANSRKAYWGITLAVLFYFLGEFSFVLQGLSIGWDNIPYPSIADLFWAIGTVFIIDELFFMVSVINVKFTKKQLTAIYGITALSILSLVIFVFGDVIIHGYDESYTPFMKAMDLYYFTGDILILFATIYVVFGLFAKTGLKFSTKHLSWIFLIIGNISMIFGDTIYSYFGLNGTNLVISFGPLYSFTFIYGNYSIDNLLYVLQYMFWALSFGLFPAYLNRSFTTKYTDDETVPIEIKKNMNFTVPSVNDPIIPEETIIANSLTFNQDQETSSSSVDNEQPNVVTNQPFGNGDQSVRND